MPVYGYRCRECGETRDSLSREDARPCPCGGHSRRDYRTVNIGGPGLLPHFNHSVGAYVSSERDFADKLKMKSEENTIRTGAEHNYVRVDPGDLPRPSTETEAFEKRERTIRDKRLVEVSKGEFA